MSRSKSPSVIRSSATSRKYFQVKKEIDKSIKSITTSTAIATAGSSSSMKTRSIKCRSMSFDASNKSPPMTSIWSPVPELAKKSAQPIQVSKINRPRRESTSSKKSATGLKHIKVSNSSKKKIRIVAVHQQHAHFNMNSLQKVFEKVDKMSKQKRENPANDRHAETSDFIKVNFLENAAVELYDGDSVAIFKVDECGYGVCHLKPGAKASPYKLEDSSIVSCDKKKTQNTCSI